MSLVVGVHPEKYSIDDARLMKPLCHQKIENGLLEGSMLVQSIDKVTINSKKKITYFIPNNIALLLSQSQKSLEKAKEIYNKKFLDPELELDFEKMDGEKKESLSNVSSLVCDYLENIQTSIVFGYTALEAFVNLSIPSSYEYKSEKNAKGISETFDKVAIERWLTLRIKIKNILTQVYKTKSIEGEKWWGNFTNLEKYRNDIIHQKSIDHTEFYKVYFKQGTFEVCKSPLSVIRFFHDAHADENRTNPIWPWIEGAGTLPITYSYDSSNFEVVGNLYEGIKKKL